MDFKNVLLAIVLSTAVLVGWATFFEPPIVEQQVTEKTITENEAYFHRHPHFLNAINWMC